MTKHLLTALFALFSAPALALPMLYGFDGSVGCFGVADCTGPRAVTAQFSIDPALDLNPAADLGRYAGTDLKLTLADTALPIVGMFEVFTFNDEFGAFCGFGVGHQRRDRISIVSITDASRVSAIFDVCNSNALTSGSLGDANLSLFGPGNTSPGDSLVLAGTGLLPNQTFPEALGTTRAIYALPPSAAVPEPSTLLLLAAAFGLLAIHRSRLRARAR